MRNILVTLLILTLPALAKPVTIEKGVTMNLPKGFRAMTAQEKAVKFPNSRAPQSVYTNESTQTTIAVGRRSQALTPAQIDELGAALASSLPQMVKGLEWISKDGVKIGGRKFFRLEFISQAVDTKIHNEMLGTSHNGRLLVVNINSTVAEYPKYKARLLKARNSIRLK